MKLDSATGNALTTVTATDADNDAANWAGLYNSGSNIRVTNTTLSNSLTGATTINSLGLNAASTLNLGGNTLNVASGGVAIQSASGTVLITNGTLTTGADVLYLGTGTDNAANFQARMDAVISGDVDVVKSGYATLYLQGSNSNTYTGDTYVNYGPLYLEKTGTAVAVPGDLVVRDGAALYVRATANATNSQLGASSSVTLGNSYVNIAANALMAVGGKLTLNNSFVEVIYNNTATNMLRLTGAGTGFEFNGGVVQHNATIDGTMSILTDVSYGAASTTQARFETMATNGSKLNVALNWGGDSGTATRTFDIADSGTLAAGQAEMRVDASLVNGGSGTTAGALRKTGSGVLQLVASNSYTGGTTVEAGTLQISTLSSAAQSNLSGVVSGSTLTFLEPIAGDFVPGQILNFNGTERVILSVVDDYRVAVNANPTAGLYSNTITSSNFTRTGSIQGNVDVKGGTLQLDNVANTVGGSVTVSNGGTLSGIGTIAGATTIGGTHSPGNSPGVQTFDSDLSYEATAQFNWELISNADNVRGTDFDGVNVGGNLSITDGAKINLVLNSTGSSTDFADSFWTSDQSWLVFDLTGAGSTTGNFTVGTISLDSVGNSYLSYGSFSTSVVSSDVYLNWTAVPEPSTYALLALGAAAIGGYSLRRRRR